MVRRFTYSAHHRNCLWARRTESQAAEVAIRVGVLNRMADLARPQSVRIA